MNSMPDPLETELASLMPCELSANSRQRITGRLSSPEPAFGARGKLSIRGRLFKQMAFACGLAAACLLAVILWQQGRQPIDDHPVVLDDRMSIEVEPAPRTLLAYHHALSSSPDELDAEFSTFSWPIPEATPKRIASAIPADLLD
jgi:hypothetical protein